jgi:hypothetical protein
MTATATATNLRNLKSSELVTMYNTAAAKLGVRPVNKFSDKETAISRTRALLAKVGTEVTAEEVRRTSSFPPPPSVAPAAEPEPKTSPKDETTAAAVGATTVILPTAATGKRLAKVAKRPGRELQERASKAPKAKAAGPMDNLPKVGNRMSFAFKPRSDAKAPKGSATTLRSLCYARMLKGCTFTDVITLIKDFDSGRGKGNANTIERRAYELVRLMHYALGFGIEHNEATGVLKLYTK